MFLGDARPNGEKDEWIFIDVDSIQQVIIPAVRTALKVHQVKEFAPETLSIFIIFSDTY